MFILIGRIYYSASAFDPELGRFTQADTIVPNPSDPQSLNRYSYCDGNPINYTDPTGHFKFKDLIGHIVGGVVGTIAGFATGNPAIGVAVYSAISSGITAAQIGMPIGKAIGIGVASGLTSFFVGNSVFSALGGATWAIPYAAAAGGASGAIVGAALSGANIGEAAAAGAVGGAIGSAIPVFGPMLGSGVASEMSHGDFWEGAAQGAASMISSAIASGAFQTAIDYGRNIEEKVQISKAITWQRANDPYMLMGGLPDPGNTKDTGLRSPFGVKGLIGGLLASAGGMVMFAPLPGARIVGGAMILTGAALGGWDYYQSTKAAENLAVDTGQKWINMDKENWDEVEPQYRKIK